MAFVNIIYLGSVKEMMDSFLVRKGPRLCSVLLLASAMSTLIGAAEGASSHANQEEWVYYGFPPAADCTAIDLELGARFDYTLIAGAAVVVLTFILRRKKS